MELANKMFLNMKALTMEYLMIGPHLNKEYKLSVNIMFLHQRETD